MNPFFRITMLIILSLLISVGPALSATFPAKPPVVIVPAPPGGTADISMRIIAHKLGEFLGHQVVVDNRPGAGGVIAAQAAAHAAPDGYTMLMNYTSHAINPSLYKKMPYDSVKDFTPVTLLGRTPLVLVVHPSVPAKNMAEFIAYAKANPGKLNYGSAAIGGASHLGGELLNEMAGIQVVHIPYKGGAAAASDLISGQIQMGLDSLLPLQSHIKSGKIRALGVTSAKRTAIAPDLPAIAETIPGFEATAWFGIMAPAGTPRELVLRWNAELVRVLKDPEIKDKLTKLGFEVAATSPEEYVAFLKAETDKWSKVVKKAGIQPQ